MGFNLFIRDFLVDFLQRVVVSSMYDSWFFIVLLRCLLMCGCVDNSDIKAYLLDNKSNHSRSICYITRVISILIIVGLSNV